MILRLWTLIALVAGSVAGQASHTFEGPNHVTVSGSHNVNPIDGATLCSWVYVTTGGAIFNRALSKEGGVNFEWFLQIASGNVFQAGCPTVVTTRSVDSPSGVTPNLWTHLCVTFSQISGGADLQIILYQDNQTISGQLFPGESCLGSSAIGDDWNIGALQSGGGLFYFEGRLAHASVWDRALSGQEISSVVLFPGSIADGLQIYYPLWGSAAEDYSSNHFASAVGGVLTQNDNGPPAGLRP